MKIRTKIATGAVLGVAFGLTGCAGAGDTATDMARSWLDGDASIQCLGQPAPWSSYELGAAQLTKEVDGGELWAVALSGIRNGAPVDKGYVLVEVRTDGGSCVRWSQP